MSTEFSRQEYLSGLPHPPLGDLPYPGIEPASLMSPTLAGRFFTAEPSGKPETHLYSPRINLGVELLGLQAHLTLVL